MQEKNEQNFEAISDGLECDIQSTRYDFEHVNDSFERKIFFIAGQNFENYLHCVSRISCLNDRARRVFNCCWKIK